MYLWLKDKLTVKNYLLKITIVAVKTQFQQIKKNNNNFHDYQQFFVMHKQKLPKLNISILGKLN